jgi:hypothetical protein|tara:strand:- start:3893 stop:4081 length:189 start_codon:yes stop_codon:yes gene_type:complete
MAAKYLESPYMVMTDKHVMYIVNWILDECDESHQDIDPRTLDENRLLDMVKTAIEAWDGGAR